MHLSATSKFVLNNLSVELRPIQKNLLSGRLTSAYIHIPFCRRRCFYCDFPISVMGDRAHGENSQAISHYIDVLCQEIAITPPPASPLQTVFFGGGTPSLLSTEQLAQTLNALDQWCGLRAEAEISMEVDPGTFTLEQLQGYRRAGVNRVSVGAQAFQPELLAACGRSHTVDQIYAAIEIIQQVEFTNFSLDLISGLPNQSLEQWQDSLEAAIKLAPTHLSTYDLVIEPTTVFGRQYQPGILPLPADETTAQMYRLAGRLLREAGYEHYEISNYAQPGCQCCHNRVYWENRPYYGFGMGATSYVHNQRYSRPRTRREYFQWVQSLITSGGAVACPQTTATDILLETLMLGLRLAEGLSLKVLSQKFGSTTVERILSCLQPYFQQGWVDLFEPYSVDSRIRLTDPEGFLFSNTVLVALWTEFDSDMAVLR